MVRIKLGAVIVKVFGWLWPGILAAAVALSVVSWVKPQDVPLVDRYPKERPCKERACYMLLNDRITNNEQKLKELISVKTQDRFTGTDAKRSLSEMRAYVDRGDADNRKTMEAMRLEMNKRMDALHTK